MGNLKIVNQYYGHTQMKPYQNLNGNSTVQSFQIYGDGIKIKFNNGDIVLYLYDKSGEEVVEKMKTLATTGKGLGTYIQSSANGLGDRIPKS